MTAEPSNPAPQQAPPSAASAQPLPSDVNPASLSRVPLIRREDMDEDGKRVYDVLMGPQTRTLAGLQGPYGIWLHSPQLGEKLLAASQHLRYQTDLGRRLTELATLVVARELDNQFEWTAHEPAALRDGLEQNIIDIVKIPPRPRWIGRKRNRHHSHGPRIVPAEESKLRDVRRGRAAVWSQGRRQPLGPDGALHHDRDDAQHLRPATALRLGADVADSVKANCLGFGDCS